MMRTMQIRTRAQSGFTLIEMIVSLAVFSIVITISVGALLVLIASNEQLQKEQSVMTNLSFALDSMTRELRTGTNYYCERRPNIMAGGGSNIFNPMNNLDSVLGNNTQDCASGNNGNQRFHGVSFTEGGDSITGAGNERILYYFDNTSGQIFRRVGGQTPQSIVSSGIYIMNAEFFVTGSKPIEAGSPNEEDQAAVTIFIEAREANDPTAKPYRLQTTVTQRTLDI